MSEFFFASFISIEIFIFIIIFIMCELVINFEVCCANVPKESLDEFTISKKYTYNGYLIH